MSKRKLKNEHVQVFVRCRPALQSELVHPVPVEVHPGVNKILVRDAGTDKHTGKAYLFDKVFGPEAQQADVYAAAVAPVVKEIIMGYNCTVFAYGQTGTGKTFTIEGCKSANIPATAEDPLSGIIPRAMRHLFSELASLKADFKIYVSFLELHNEEIFDLLSNSEDLIKLKLFDSSSQKGSVIVQGLKIVPVTSMEEVYTILHRGCKKRRTAATLLNKISSRSHSIFTVTVNIKESSKTMEFSRTGKLNLVDLAGSENIGKSGAVNMRAREAGNINQSLLALGRVITSLSENAVHIPYRESKLTRLLQDSLGGLTKTTLIATISPSAVDIEETLNTLEYAFRAKSITNKPEVNAEVTSLMKDYTKEVNRLKKAICDLGRMKGFFAPEEHIKYWETSLESKREEKLKIMSQLEVLTDESKLIDATIIEKNDAVHRMKKDLEEERNRQENLRAEIEKEKEKLKLQEKMLSAMKSLHNSAHDKLHNDLEANSSLELDLKKVKEEIKSVMEERAYLSEKVRNLRCNRMRRIELFNEGVEDLSKKVKSMHDYAHSLTNECNNYVSMLKNGFESASNICESEFSNICSVFNDLEVVNKFFRENMESALEEQKSVKLKRIDKFKESYTVSKEISSLEPINKALDETEKCLIKFSTAIKNWEKDFTSKTNAQQRLLKEHVDKQKNAMKSTSENLEALLDDMKKNMDAYLKVVTEFVNSQPAIGKLWNDSFLPVENALSSLEIFCTERTSSDIEKINQAHSFLKNCAETGKDIANKLKTYCASSGESVDMLHEGFDLKTTDVISDKVKKMEEYLVSSCSSFDELNTTVEKCSNSVQDLDCFCSSSEDPVVSKILPKVTACFQDTSNSVMNFEDNFKLSLMEYQRKVNTFFLKDKTSVEKLSETSKKLAETLTSETSTFYRCLDIETKSSLNDESPETKEVSRKNGCEMSNPSTPPNQESTFTSFTLEYLDKTKWDTECPVCMNTSGDETMTANDFISDDFKKNFPDSNFEASTSQFRSNITVRSSRPLAKSQCNESSLTARKTLQFFDPENLLSKMWDSPSDDDDD